MIKESSIESLKAIIDIERIVSEFIKLKKDGSDFKASCPFHDEKTPSFKVSPAKNIFKCFGCGASGDAIAFVMQFKKVSYIDAIKIIANIYSFTLEEGEYKKKQYTKPVQRKEPIKSKFIKWFEARGISKKTVDDFRITEAVEWMPKSNKEVEVICFNYFMSGELTNIKFRGYEKEFKLNIGSQLIFYNIDCLHIQEIAIITEGEIDCLTLYECGLPNVVSVPNGAAKGKLEYLDNCWQFFEDKKKIILALDNDETGIELRNEIARRLGIYKCFYVQYPDGCKDSNEVLFKHGKEAIIEMFANLKEFPIEGVFTTNDLLADIVNFYEFGYPKGAKAGIYDFDDHISFMPGQLTTITGIPGSGKSEFIDHLMVCLSKNHHWPFGILSFENQPSSLHATKIMEKYIGKSFAFRLNYEHRMSKDDLENAIVFVDNFFYFINISQADVSVDGILNKAEELVIRKGVKGILIDPWNYVEHKIPAGYTETQYISESLSKIKAFALKTGVHVFLIAHPTKIQKDKATGKYEVPTMYSISGSAHFFNKTDNGITVYRNFDTNIVDIYIQKIRYSWIGKIGFSSFVYNTDTRQYITTL